MGWLLKLLGPSAGLYLGGVAVVGAVGLYGAHWWQVRGLRNEVKTVEQARDKAIAEKAIQKEAFDAMEKDRDRWVATSKEQSLKVDLFQMAAREADIRARNAGLLALRKSAEAAADLRAPTTRVPSGAEGMNEWMRGRFP